ncbi:MULTISPECIES: M3 family oligoendopeptidase [unclassified Viridibacillus]|uniref:M3 family oligoendopeptidase n=1 Tax=unclassified Viridibacillus TaxID=2617942 RepID=UPI00096E6D9D|nr:M3 family oligoendopeptidase [Viridibacillus sp. FSL H8-0123]OMC79125.1 oligoendopeptidase [Viridibacillus sp. FSL H8-0123]
MTNKKFPEVWDLESVFTGGSNSEELRIQLDRIQVELEELQNAVSSIVAEDAKSILNVLELMKEVYINMGQAGSFVSCLQAQDMTDKKASLLRGEISSLAANFAPIKLQFQQVLSGIEEEKWTDLLTTEELSQFNFTLNEWRDETKLKLSEQEENIISALKVDGYNAWGEMYDLLISDIKIPFTIDGGEKELSVGQANNLSSHPDATVRQAAYEALEKTWTEKEEFFAKTLNHIAGFRLATYKKRGWDSVLQEPLQTNRMQPETIDAMWGAITDHKAPFVEYLKRKAELLNTSTMDWFNLDAPITASTETISYQEGAAFVIKNFGRFGKKLETFATNAIENGWIEAENRPNKRPGGFCTGLPLTKESRIFMTYSGTMSNVATLAHELGHAFHSYALRPIHTLNTGYAMGVAETASTFAEMIVADAAVQEANSVDEKIALLEDKIQRSVAFFMNIHARFLFETRFYEERKEGIVPAQRLNEIMEEAQKEAYAGALNVAHPHFWASKLHFYMTSVPFYNFPYTFGYLFSLSIYAKAKEEGSSFEDKYIALLQDTAVMSVEDLAMKHLGEDITEKAFWEKGIRICEQDVEQFLELTTQKG